MKVIININDCNIIKDKLENNNTVFYCTDHHNKIISCIDIELFKYILQNCINQDYTCYIASEENDDDDIEISDSYDFGKCIILACENNGHVFTVSELIKDLDWYNKLINYDILLYNYFVPDADDYTSNYLVRIEVDDKRKIIRLHQ